MKRTLSLLLVLALLLPALAVGKWLTKESASWRPRLKQQCSKCGLA